MASFLPFIQDILPMIMPSSVHIAKAADLRPFPLPSQQLGSADEQKIELVDNEASAEKDAPPNSNGDVPATSTIPTATSGAATGLTRKDALIDKTDKMCASVITAKPRTASTVQHHGEQGEPRNLPSQSLSPVSHQDPRVDAIIYAVSGRGVLLTSPADEDSEPARHELAPGDFAFVPAWTEHQALNESAAEDMVWVVIRSGPAPVDVSLTGWGGPQIEERSRGKNV